MSLMSLNQMLAHLMKLHDIRLDKSQAYAARIKNFQRLGLLRGASVGKGIAASFSDDGLLQVAAALELCDAGLSPAAIVAYLNSTWVDVREDDDLWFHADGLAGLRNVSEEPPEISVEIKVELSHLRDRLKAVA